MKQLFLSAILFFSVGMISCKNDTKKEKMTAVQSESQEIMAASVVSFGVRGNCSMCKKTIETAALSIEGVLKATWDINKKSIEVALDESSPEIIQIHNAIAASGYDTDQVSGDLTAYEKLPLCCQYDHEMEMNQSKAVQ